MLKRLAFCVLILVSGCSSSDPSSNDQGSTTGNETDDEVTRSFELGFTPWPYDATIEAVNFVYSEAIIQGDFIAHHLDGGIPWNEALNNTGYPAAVNAELAARVGNTPQSHRTYVALSPMNGLRTGLANNWGDATNEPLPDPWRDRGFEHPDVINAYVNFSSHLIDLFTPEYFNIGIEASELILNDLQSFEQYVEFVRAVSPELKRRHPNVSLMISVALKSPESESAGTIRNNISELISLIDSVGVSAYPYGTFDHADKGNPDTLPANWLSQISDLAQGKPVAVAETGWPAEPLLIPEFGLDVQSDEQDQARYVSKLLDDAEALNAEFIVWFSLVDYDALWSGVLAEDPIARVWRDTGLYDHSLTARAGLFIWEDRFQLQVDE